MSDAPRSDSAESSSSGGLCGGRYRILRALGSGAQGETFEAEDQTSGARVALKRFRVRGAESWKDVELAEREIRVLSQLSYPNLPRYLHHFEEDGALYLVMEKIEGRSLGELRRAKGSLRQADVRRMLLELGQTLRYLHAHAPPLIHRDIKPNNVIWRADGSFALVDFGSVRDRLRPEGGSTVVGTFGYMAPEQFQGRALPATDVYGLGATAIACLTGEEPENLPHHGLAVDVPRALAGQADPALVGLLSELLDPNPDQRASDVPRAFERHLGRATPRADTTEAPSRRSRRRAAAPDARGRRFESDLPGAHRKQARPHGGPPLAGVVLLAVLSGLLVARFATFGLFRLFLPVLLGVLALFFGAGLRRAAERMAEIGRAGDHGLRRAARHLRGQLSWRERHRGNRARYRVSEVDYDRHYDRHDLDADADADGRFDHDPERRRSRR